MPSVHMDVIESVHTLMQSANYFFLLYSYSISFFLFSFLRVQTHLSGGHSFEPVRQKSFSPY